MSFEFHTAVRQNVPLIIGLAGSTGSGKTYSALRLAKGLAGDARFALIDTEAGRALHYADEFPFDHGSLEAPFTPTRYAEAIKAADAAGYPVIVVDSASHEHAGDGGLLDMHEDVLRRMAGDDWKRREASTMAAWVEPKREHKRFVSQLLQLRAHLILCFRAEEKIEMAKENGRTVVRPKRSLVGLDGWIPVSEKNLPYELTLSFLLTADRPGVPRPIKLEQQHRLLLDLDQPIGEQAGVALAEWAHGAVSEIDSQIVAQVTRLLDLADQLGNRDVVSTAIRQNRRKHKANPAAHLEWLEAQCAKAEGAVGEQEQASVEVEWADDADAQGELAPRGIRGAA